MLSFTRTLRFRLALWFMAVLGAAMVVLGALIYFGLQRALLQNVDNTLRNAAVRSVIQSNGEAESERLRRLSLISLAPSRLLTLDGNTLQFDAAFPTAISVAPDLLNAIQAGNARFETMILPNVIYRLYSAPVRVDDGVDNTRVAVVQVVQSLENEYATLANLRGLIGLLMLVTLPLAGLGGWFLAGRALAPIEHVRRDVSSIIGSADLSRRVSNGLPDDEVGKLARTFDGLLARIEDAMARERQFTADASHELRSPLAALKGEISVALNRPRSASEYYGTLNELEVSIDDMTRLVEDLLTLARTGNDTQLPSQPIEIVEMAMSVCDRLMVVAHEKSLELRVKIDAAQPIVAGDRSQLARVITNLVDNAIRYTSAGGVVEVRVSRNITHALIEVQDTGIGIAPEHVPHIFDRFYRTDSARSRENGGTGLGLAIAQAIMKRHGGDILVTSEVGVGSLFTMRIPLIAEQ